MIMVSLFSDNEAQKFSFLSFFLFSVKVVVGSGFKYPSIQLFQRVASIGAGRFFRCPPRPPASHESRSLSL